MALIVDSLPLSLEKKLEDLLKPFLQERDYTYDPSMDEPIFNYEICIKRLVNYTLLLQDKNREIPCGHSKGDLWKEQHADAIEYCTICRLHDEIEDAEEEANKWRAAIENALGLEIDEVNHTPEWAEEIILNLREIGNRK